MTDRPINPDREQQRRDNIASRRQSGLEPLPQDLEEERAEQERKARSRDERRRERGGSDALGRRVEAASGGEPVAGLEAEGRAEAAPERRAAGQAGSGDAEAGTSSSDRPAGDSVTAADRAEETRRAERVQQSGEGIHGVSTQGREDWSAEDEVRDAAEGRGEGQAER